jgi:serine/threonine protein phosphatase PrpC
MCATKPDPGTVVDNLKVSSFGLSDRGKMREENEDMFYVDDSKRVYAVADGLGGLPCGALASKLAIKLLGKSIEKESNGKLNFEDLFNNINETVYIEGKKVSEEVGIGTTLTVIHLKHNYMDIGHIGDCTAYICRNKKWHKLTTDHTMEEEIRSRLAPDDDTEIPDYFSHTLTRCIGQQGEIETDVYKKDLKTGDRILICSDGISKILTEEELHDETLLADTPESLIRSLIDIANDRGGPDNSTGIAIFVS